MKMQRIAILLAAMGLVIALEVVMTHAFTRDETLSAPVPTADQADPGAPGASSDAAPLPTGDLALNTVPPLSTVPAVPGNTSPPAYVPPTRAPATKAPSPTKAPAPTKAPTPAPTEEPTNPPDSSVGSTLSNGSFSSNTGTSLNLNVSWSATDLGGGKARISITGTVSSYSLNVSSRPVSISFGNYSASVTGSSISVPNDSLSSNRLFSTSMDVDTDAEGTMTVSWNFNGEYSDMSLPEVTASGYVYM